MLNFPLPRLPFKEDKLFGVMVLASFTIPLFFYFGTYEKFETVKFSLFVFFAGAGLLAWAGQARPVSTLRQRLFVCLLGGWALMVFLATLFSQDRVTSVLGSYLRFANGFSFYLAWLVLLAMFLTLAADKEKRGFFYKLLFLDALAVAVISLFQSLGIGYYEGLNMPVLTRAPGPLGNPNFSAMFMAACLGFAVPLWLSAKTLPAKAYYAVSAGVILLAVVVLASRGSWLGLAASLLFAVMISIVLRLPLKTSLAWLLLGLVGLAFWAGFSRFTPRPQTISSAVQLTDANVNSRLSVWSVAAKAILDKPFFGFGPGNFVLAYEAHRGSSEAALGIFDDPHNLFIQLAAETGIPALLFFLGLLAFAFWRGLRQLAGQKDVFVISALSGCFGLLVAACFNPFSVPNYLLLAFFIAVLAAGTGGGKEGEGLAVTHKRPKNLYRIAGVVFCLFGAAFLSSEVIFFQGLKAFNEGDFGQAEKYFSWAQKLNPYQELSGVYRTAANIGLNAPTPVIQSRLDSVARLHPKRSAAYSIESNLYYFWYFYDRQEKHLDAAISSMKKAVLLDPYFGRRYGRLGYYYLLKNDSGKALAEMQKELKMEPSYLPGWLLLAKAYQSAGDAAGTILALKQAAALRPDLADLKNLAKAAESVGDVRRLIIPGGISPAILE